MTDDKEIKDQGNLRRYFTQIPNSIIRGHLGKNLDAIDLAVYTYMKSRAGEDGTGSCYASLSTISESLKVGRDRIIKSKRILKDNGLVSIKKTPGKPDQISLLDVWDDNFSEYSASSTSRRDRRGASVRSTGVVDEIDGGSRSDRLKEEPYKKNTSRRTIKEEGDVSGGSVAGQGEGVRKVSFVQAEKVAESLLKAITTYQPEHRYNRNRPALKTWIRDIERAIRLDGRTVDQLQQLIDYTFTQGTKQADFWAGNVQSGKKLRNYFDRMVNDYRRELKSETGANHGKSIDERLDRIIGSDD